MRDALERVKMVPAAGGAPGTRISFGNWTHRGWMGAGYLVARRLDPDGEPFDPNEHEAVAHEPGDGGEHVVAETLRAGYRWQGHLLRPVMVRVKD